MKRVNRTPDGFFVPPGKMPANVDTTSKYITNPETGLLEKNPYFDPNAKPASPQPIQTSFDDMLKNLDDMVQQSTSPKLDFESMAESLDQLMVQTQPLIPDPPGSSERIRRERITSPERERLSKERILSPERTRRSTGERVLSPDRESSSRGRVLSPERSRRDRVLSPRREREYLVVSSERNSRESTPEKNETPRGEATNSMEVKKTEEELMEQERKEMEKQIRDLNRLKAEQRAANRREAEMVAHERIKRTQLDRERKQRRGSTSTEFSLISSQPPDESLIVHDYVTALMTTLRNDPTVSPVPGDFLTPDGYAHWKTSMRRSFQEVLIKMLKYRFLQKPEPVNTSFEPVELRFRVFSASGLRSKEGKHPQIVCSIEYGDMSLKSKKREKFETDAADSLSPVWNQSMTIEVKNITDKINLSVYDRQKSKDYFLGHVTISLADLITQCARTSEFEKEYPLEPLDKKEKYVGGSIKVGAYLLEQFKKSSAKSYQEIQTTLNSLQVDNNSLFDLMIRTCMVLDLFTPRDGRHELLSPESVSMLKLWARTWSISDAYQVISHLKVMFEKYQQDQVSISDLLKAFHFLYATVKHRGLFPDYEVFEVDADGYVHTLTGENEEILQRKSGQV
jgi:hypothetical protein